LENKTSIDFQYFESRFEDLLNSLSADNSILVKHFGELNQDVISTLEGQVESSVIENGVPKSPLRKIFFIAVETLQNMHIHGHKNLDGNQRSFFILTKNSNQVNLFSANLIHNKSVPILEKQIDTINDFDDPAELKRYYMDHLETNQISEKGGAGLGFITIAMKSGNKLNVNFNKIDENYSMFLLNSKVNIE
jgi:hypothetical protein